MKFKAGPAGGGSEAAERIRGAVRERLAAALVEVGAELAAELGAATGPPSEAAGKAAVEGDVGSLYATPPAVAGMLRGADRDRGRAIVAAVAAGAGEARVAAMLRGTVLDGVPVRRGPDEGEHAEFLRSGHKRRRLPAAVVLSGGALRNFVRGLKARVGTARKGWVDAAADLGGSGKGWSRTGGARAGRAEVERGAARVVVRLVNMVVHAVYLLPAGRRRRLVERARRSLVEMMGREI